MKRICSWLLTLALVLGLCACGQSAEAEWQEQYDLGVRYLSEGNYEEAIIAFTAAIEIDPKRPEGYTGRGDAYALSGDTADNLSAALADYEAALALDETLADAWLGLADVYIRQGDYEKAMEILREALEKTGSDQSIADKLSEMESGSFADSAGHVRRMNSYDGAGNLIWYHIYTYDGEGRQASATSFDAAGNQTGHVDRSYTESGEPLVGCYYAEDGVIGKVTYEYDAAGNAVEMVHYTVEGGIEYIYQSEYDGNGNVIREDQREADGTLFCYSTFTYDGEGREIRSDTFDADGTPIGYKTHTYNAAGDTEEYCDYAADGTLIWRHVYRYDDQGTRLGYDAYDGEGNLSYSTVNEG